MNQAVVSFGLVGLGHISRAHIAGYHSAAGHARIVAVCDTDPELAKRVGKELGAAVYTNYHDLVNDQQVEAVDIALPHHLHYEVAQYALSASKHVLLEKPMAPTERECESLIALANRYQVIVSVAENARFVTAYTETEKLLQNGTIGVPRLVRTLIYGSEVVNLTNKTHWRSRAATSIGGAILDSSPHTIYLLKWLFGKIEFLNAFAYQLVKEVSEVEDNAAIRGRIEGGPLFSAEFTFTAEIPWGERLEVYGTEGTIVVDQLHSPPAILFRGASDITGAPLSAVPYDPTGWKFASIASGVAAFATAISRNEPPPIDPRDGSYVLKVVERAYQSARAEGAKLAL